ncbi:mammalian cell entry protein [Mycobacterium sp. Root265]|uniref:MCE family protein n=1 Tax=Mycobacterium sp. Root265 TaxID=1736504 RepID=UPI00070CBCE8|nr:MCE family protein [Mycobacterium sp. Root265]KRD05725.1 mammalian cell entry protein [Mycobacterium sp. Root265]
MTVSRLRIGLAFTLVVLVLSGLVYALGATNRFTRTTVTAYFANSNGIFTGDEVRILGIPVGEIERIEPEPDRVKITFYFGRQYKVPAEAKAVILSPNLVTSRALELTPAYTGGSTMQDDAVIPQERTAVPVEWDDFRAQLERLTETLQPAEPGGVSTLGAFIDTAADNLRGEGANIRDTLVKLSQAFSALGDHSTDIFSTVRNLSTLVSGLQGSADLMAQLNRNLAAVTGVLANDPTEVSTAAEDLNTVVGQVQTFVADNRETVGITTDKLASITQALNDSRDDIKQTLHVTPTSISNFVNIYQPAQATFTGVLAAQNFSNPVGFLCGAIQAASRLNAEQSAKLCVQYLSPIVKNRMFNFPPIGLNPIVGAQTRPNEVTYSEEWMRPDYVPPPPAPAPAQAPTPPDAAGPPASSSGPALAAEAHPADVPPLLPPDPIATTPSAGLPGLMVPPVAGS